jgi:hypothetical protein
LLTGTVSIQGVWIIGTIVASEQATVPGWRKILRSFGRGWRNLNGKYETVRARRNGNK